MGQVQKTVYFQCLFISERVKAMISGTNIVLSLGNLSSHQSAIIFDEYIKEVIMFSFFFNFE